MKSSKLPGMLSVKSKKGLDYMDMILKTTDLCKKFQGANGGKQCVTEHPAQLGLWSAGAEWGWQIHDLKNAHRHFAPHIGKHRV